MDAAIGPAAGSCAGEAELELTFLLAGARARRRAAMGRIRALARVVDYDALRSDLAQRRMLPLLGQRLRAVASDAVPTEFTEATNASLTHARAASLALDTESTRLVRLLEQSGIRAMKFKGSSLAQAAHGDIGLRSAADIDLLVAREDLPGAVRRVVEEGYAAPAEGDPAEVLPQLHFTLARPGRPTVEIHWRVHWYEEAFSRDLLERAAPGPDGLLEPTAADMAVALLLFYARDGFHGLRIPADIAGWYDRRLGAGAASLLDSHVKEYPKLARSIHAAALTAELVAGVPAATWLDRPATDRHVRLAMRLSNWEERGDRAQQFANLGLVDGLLTPSGAFPDFIRRELATGPQRGRPRHLVTRMSRQLAGLWLITRRPWSPVPPGIGA